MDWNIKSRNIKLHDRQREYIQEKLSKLERYLDGISEWKVECRFETLRGMGDVFTVQVTMLAEHGVILRAEDRDKDLNAAVDAVHDNLQRQIRRFKEKHYRRGKLRRSLGGEIISAPFSDNGPDQDGAEPVEERQIVRAKDVTLRPMFSDEAIEQMELLGHSFFVYRDAETEKVSVVYRRTDGNYGLIMPK
ncbi:MAG TPA: ribosome-associated translation inhibitor RaiA [Herpetosiphonaceae bacterium]|nr:ribosome-associated translation inhibitor RaiA [Herpetosiphonaceae bacterium]